MREYSDPVMEARLRKASKAQGFNQWFGLDCIAAGGGEVELEVDLREDHKQHHGYVHGGVVSSMADTAAAWAAATYRGDDVVTSNFTFHFLAPAVGDKLRAHARVLRGGRSQITVEAQVFALDGGGAEKLVGAGLAAIAVLPQKLSDD